MVIVERQAVIVIGIAARTGNAREMSGQGVIARQWESLRAGDLLARVPGRTDADILAVYTDYETDENGEYTFLLGVKADGAPPPAAGMVVHQIPAGRYALFTSDEGPVPDVVVATWQRIWREQPSAEYRRTYRTDIEVYGARAADPRAAVIEIYIGVV